MSRGRIHHFTDVCLVTWSLNGGDAGNDLILIETSLILFISSCSNASLHYMRKAKVSIRARSFPTSLPFIGQVTKHTTVKWLILGQAHDIFN